MKKILSLIVFLLIIAVGYYLYSVSQFNDYIEKNIISVSKNNDAFVKVEFESVKYSKLSKKIILKGIKVTPGKLLLQDKKTYDTLNELAKIQLDKAYITSDFFGTDVRIITTGEVMKHGAGKSEIYLKNPDLTITINKNLIEKDFKNASLNIKQGESTYYFSSNDMQIIHTEYSDMDLSSSFESGKYNIKINATNNKISIDPEYFVSIEKNIAKLDPILEKQMQDMKQYHEFRNSIYSVPTDLAVEIELGFNEQSIKNATQHAMGGMFGALGAYSELSKSGTLVKFKYSIDNEKLKSNNLLYLNLNDKKVDFEFKANYKPNFSKEEQKKYAKIIANNIMFAGFWLNIDYKKLTSYMIDTGEFGAEIKVSYDADSGDITGGSSLVINNLSSSINGKCNSKNMLCSGEVTVDTPMKLMVSLTNLYNEVLHPNDDFYKYLYLLHHGGFEVFQALHHKDNLSKTDIFKSNIEYNGKNHDFKVNGKSFIELMQDSRIMHIMQNMPR